jgi:hypothetical protein
MHRRSVVLFALAFAGSAGCGKNDGRVEVYPVSGKVLSRGAPAEGAEVTFYPVAQELKKPGMPIPSAFVGSTGTFHLRSYDPEDGAPAGEYNVTVFWPAPRAANAPHESESLGGKDRLGERYMDPLKSGLKATVPEGGAELPPFEVE